MTNEDVILDELRKINERLDRIEKANKPFGPYTPPPNLPPFNPRPIVKNCPTCGIKLEGVMGYCCPRGDCPTGMGPVMC